MVAAEKQNQCNIDKVLSWLDYGLANKLGLHCLPGEKYREAHDATIDGRVVKFYRLEVSQHRLYTFEHAGNVVVAALFAAKKTQKTSKQHCVELEAIAKAYFAAFDAQQLVMIKETNGG